MDPHEEDRLDREWEKRQGGPILRWDNRKWYASGGIASLDLRQRGEPLPNAYDNLTKRVRRYRAELLRRGTVDFRRVRAAVLGQSDPVKSTSLYNPQVADGLAEHDPNAAVTSLERLQALVLDARAKLAEVDRLISETPEAKEKERLRQMDEDAARDLRQRDQAVQSAAYSITI